MKTVLVTGSEGQLGKCLQKISASYGDISFFFETKNTLDIRQKEALTEVFNRSGFDFCINCAAYTDVERAEKEPVKAFEVNALGVKNLALACLETQTKLVQISTDYVFDGKKSEGYYPSDTPNPINEYGRSKLAGENWIREILTDFVIVRTSWLYSEYGNNFYKTILAKAAKGEDLQVTDEQLGCPTNANNLAVYLLEKINTAIAWQGIHHYTDGEAMSWFTFANKILEENGLEKKINIVKARNYRTFAARPKNSVLKSAEMKT